MTRIKPAQRRELRSPRLFVVPVVLLSVAIADLAWEIVRANLSQAELGSLPFAPVTLGIGPAATFAAAVIAVLLARAQFAAVNYPHLAGHSAGWVGAAPTKRWTLVVHNVGSGIAHLRVVQYQWQTKKEVRPSEWLSSDDFRNRLRSSGFRSPIEFDVNELSPGLPMKPGSAADGGLEIVSVGNRLADETKSLNVRVRFSDRLGDRYSWTKDIAEEFNRR